MQGRAEFAAQGNVSRETLGAFDIWHSLLVRWNASINLVQKKSLEQFWTRHAADSWQVTDYIPNNTIKAIDLGSGGGFPGLAVGIWLKQRGAGEVTLVESAGKKASFLRTAAREMGLPVNVEAKRAESLPSEAFDLITARAFAPLPRLLTYADRFSGPSTQLILPKGRQAPTEIEQAKSDFDFKFDSYPSISDPEGQILVLTDLKRCNPQGTP